MAEEDEEAFYQNIAHKPTNNVSRYDEVTINFGKPVLRLSGHHDDDLFASVSFTSPIEDLKKSLSLTPPVPAPRLSLKKNNNQQTANDEHKENIDEESDGDSQNSLSGGSSARQRPQIPPRASVLTQIEDHSYENVYSEIIDKQEDDDDDTAPLYLGARPRRPQNKADTIAIRTTVSEWYDQASQEIERDLSLDLSVLDHDHSGKNANNNLTHSYEHVALDDKKVNLIHGRIQPQASTLLRDFDPILEPFNPVMSEVVKEEESDDEGSSENEGKSENLYVAVPSRSLTTSPSQPRPHSEHSFDLPPTSPPPPLPKSEPPVAKNTVSYENIWLDGSQNKKPQIITTPPPVPPRLRSKQPSFLANDDSAFSSSASSSSNDVHALSSWPPSTSPQRSFSALNLASKLTSNIKRKMSVQQTMSAAINNIGIGGSKISSPSLAGRRRSGLLNESSSVSMGIKTRSGVLYVYSRSRRAFQPKWCVLDHGDLKYFNDKQTVAVPKETVAITSILSLKKYERASYAPHNVEIFTFSIAYMKANSKHTILILGAATPSDRDKWLDKIVSSLDYNKLASMTTASKLAWVQLKTGFAGIWHKSWISISDRILKYTEDFDRIHEIDLKKIKNMTLVKEVKNLAAPLSQNLPVLVMDCLDRSLYLQCLAEKEALSLKESIECIAFSNSNNLEDQQLTSEDIPVIVDKCISFVYGHGCMTEGIYRHSGVNTKINRLLELFKDNAWAVHLTRDSFSEHDVANALKRFFRTLNEPLLTEKLRHMFLQAAAVEEVGKKTDRYRNLVKLLPPINYNTLKRLLSHLKAISGHAGKNLMPNYNLGAIWGPSLLTVDSMEASTYAQTSSESDVCRDLIDYYTVLFDVPPEELEREAKISEVLEKLSKYDRGRCLLKRSGDLRLWVYIDTKSSGNCVCVVVKPSMTAMEMTRQVIADKSLKEGANLVLHEVVLGGALQRPIHHSELVLDVTLKWGVWGEQDRRDNYLLLKRNILYEEAVGVSVPPMTVFGEALYSDLKMKSFKKFNFSMSNARLTVSKSEDSEVAAWPIEDISWYFGCEPKRHPPNIYNVTFIHRQEAVVRSKDRPHFGRTISFESRDFYIKWIAAMLVAEYANDVKPKAEPSNIPPTSTDEEKLLLLDD